MKGRQNNHPLKKHMLQPVALSVMPRSLGFITRTVYLEATKPTFVGFLRAVSLYKSLTRYAMRG